MEVPTGGQILFEGTDITDPKVDINRHRQKIGMVFQQFNLFPHKTVKQNIMLAPVELKLMTKDEASKKADELLARVGLPDKANAYPDMLSGGQKQRISIARALLKDAPSLILDEATSALDSESENQIKEALETLMKGRTCLTVAHRLSTIDRADRIVVMQDGVIAEEGTPAELMARGGTYARMVRLQMGI